MRILFFLLLLLSGNFCSAQISANWAYNFSENGKVSEGRSIALDDQKNLYVTGGFSGSMDMDPSSGYLPLSTFNLNRNAFVAKYDSTGRISWAFSIGGNNNDSQGNSICLDKLGNIYVTGYYEGDQDFDPSPTQTSYLFSNSGTADAFIAKYRQDGTFLWAKSIGGGSFDEGKSISADASGVYVTGNYESNSMTVNPDGGNFVNNQGLKDIFLLKLDVNGSFLWGGSIGWDFDDEGRGIVTDGNSVYITGNYSGNNVDFDFGAGLKMPIAQGSTDIYLSKYNATDGSFEWLVTLGSNEMDEGNAIALGESNSVWITGGYKGNMDVDPNPGSSTYLFSQNSSVDAYVAHYDAAGNYLHAFSIGSGGDDSGNGIVTSPSGNMFLTGSVSGYADFNPGPEQVIDGHNAGVKNTFLAKYDKDARYLNSGLLRGDNIGEGLGIATDGIGNLFLTGYASGSGWLDPKQMGYSYFVGAAADIIIGKYDTRIPQILNTSSMPFFSTYGNPPITLTASTSSNLPLSYSTANPSVATVSGNTLTITGGGSTTITTRQDGNEDYLPIMRDNSFSVNPAVQTITFGPLPVKKYGDPPFTLSATSSSGLPVKYTIYDTTIASVIGNTVTIKKVGNVVIRASQAGNSNFQAAMSVDQTLLIELPGMAISGREIVAENSIQVYNIVPSIPNYIYYWSYSDPDVLIPDTVGASIAAIFNKNSTDGILRCRVHYPNATFYKTFTMNIKVNQSTVSTLPETECSAVDSFSACSGSYIDFFELASLKNEGSACSSGGYGDYTQSNFTTTLFLGDVYQADLRVGYNGVNSVTYYTGLWIDYNNNANFDDPGEFLSSFYGTDSIVHLINLPISSNTDYTGARRLRVRVRTSGQFNSSEGCLQQGETSETEDYLINLRSHDELQAPSFITPNNDGKNDFFVVQGMNSKTTNKLIVFDRMGGTKFSQENYDNKWDGKDLNGEILPRGTYYYIFTSGKSDIRGFCEITY